MISFPLGNLKPGVDYIARLICVCICATQSINHPLFPQSELIQIPSLFLPHRANMTPLWRFLIPRYDCVKRFESKLSCLSVYVHTHRALWGAIHKALHKGTQAKSNMLCCVWVRKPSVCKWKSSPCQDVVQCQLPQWIIFLFCLKIEDSFRGKPFHVLCLSSTFHTSYLLPVSLKAAEILPWSSLTCMNF